MPGRCNGVKPAAPTCADGPKDRMRGIGGNRMSILAFVTAVAAMLCFSLAMARRHRDLFGRSPSRPRQLLYRLTCILRPALVHSLNIPDCVGEFSLVTASCMLMGPGI